MPRFVALPTSIIRIQKLSCSAGQWYLAWLRSITRLVMVDCDEAILGGSYVREGSEVSRGSAAAQRETPL